jgi:hypothetical protein
LLLWWVFAGVWGGGVTANGGAGWVPGPAALSADGRG